MSLFPYRFFFTRIYQRHLFEYWVRQFSGFALSQFKISIKNSWNRHLTLLMANYIRTCSLFELICKMHFFYEKGSQVIWKLCLSRIEQERLPSHVQIYLEVFLSSLFSFPISSFSAKRFRASVCLWWTTTPRLSARSLGPGTPVCPHAHRWLGSGAAHLTSSWC